MTDNKRAAVYIHGKDGHADEAKRYEPLFPRREVIGFDYKSDTPWDAKKEFSEFFASLKKEYGVITVIANSIGAYFSMCASLDRYVDKAYFISPIVDMAGLIENMMKASGVSENELKEKIIIGDLSWDYYVYVKEHPISWKAPTEIIYGSEDKLQSYETVSRFASRFNCGLTVMVGGEHWFHTEKQLRFLDGWLKEKEKI